MMATDCFLNFIVSLKVILLPYDLLKEKDD